MEPELLKIAVQAGRQVSALLLRPSDAWACYVMAHGAGAGMTHPSMECVAVELAERGIATLRYQFPFMENGTKRPDPPALAHATVRAAVAEAHRLEADLPLIAGGRSFGGRMTSQAQALEPLPGVLGLAFLAFPLHPPKQPSADRAKHLSGVDVPLLFLQGSRDALATLEHLQPLCADLGNRATLKVLADADHSFHVPARSGRTNVQVRSELLDAFAGWAREVLGNTRAAEAN